MSIPLANRYSGTPPYARVSFYTAQQGSKLGAWSESFWWTGSNTANCIADSMALLQALGAPKSPSVWMPYFRISILGLSRQVRKGFQAGTANLNAVSTGAAVVPAVKVLVWLANSVGAYTAQWIGGLPASAFSTGNFAPSQAVANGLSTIFTTLGTGAWSIRKLSLATVNKPQPNVSISQAGVVTAPAHGIPDQSMIRVGRFVPGLGVNGLWPVTFLTANTLQLNGIPGGQFSGVPSATKGAYISWYQWVMSKIATPLTSNPGQQIQSSWIRAATHNIGRLPLQYSGRRKKARS